MRISACSNCHGRRLYKSTPVSAGGGHAPNYLPGLGGTFSAEKFHLVICRDCGLTQFFARSEAMSKLSNSKKWERI